MRSLSPVCRPIRELQLFSLTHNLQIELTSVRDISATVREKLSYCDWSFRRD
jgi:hypothetical protein